MTSSPTRTNHGRGAPSTHVDVPLVLAELPASKLFGRRQFLLVPLPLIEDWEHNPEARTESIALHELRLRFTPQIGQLQPCSAVSYTKKDDTRFRLMDGHRRKEIATSNAVGALEVVHYPDVGISGEKFGKLFDILNGGNRIVNARERTGLALDGEDGAAGKLGVKYADIATHSLSDGALQVFREANHPNSALKRARDTYKELAARGLVESSPRARKAFVSACLVWQVRHSQQRKLITMVRAAHTAAGRGSASKATRICRKLLEYIVSGVPAPDDEHDFDVD